MRKVIISLTMVVLGFGAFASPRTLNYSTGQLTENSSASVPGRVMTDNPGYYEVTYTFTSATIEEDFHNLGYYKWKIPGFYEILSPGSPAILSRRDKFQIPAGYTSSVELVSCEYQDFDINLAPSQEIYPDNGIEISTVPTPIKAYPGFMPSNPVAYLCNNSYRGTNIFELGVYPIQYNCEDKKVRAYTKITYRVNLTESSSREKSIVKTAIPYSDDPFLNNICINKSSVSNQNGMEKGISIGNTTPTTMLNETYVIVSSTKLKPAVEKFAAWKRQLGYDTKVIYGSWVNAFMVKQKIDLISNPRYLLIIGNNNYVPGIPLVNNVELAKGETSNYEYVSDRGYAFYSGNDGTEADMLYGRLPVATLEEANAVIDKIINYEKDPPTSVSFYNHGINCAYFQADSANNKVKEERRFSQTAYEISEYVNNKIGKNSTNYFYAKPDRTPKRWFEPKLADISDKTSISTDLISTNMQKPYYLWNADAAQIKADWNSGAFYVLHRGHGRRTSWEAPVFNVNDGLSLTNGNKLPVVFSINCMSGSYNYGSSMADALLTNQNGGAVAVFAPSSTTYSIKNDVLAQGFFNSIWPDPGIRTKFKDISATSSPFDNYNPKPVYRLGEIMQNGFSLLTESFGCETTIERDAIDVELNAYHCFGDPSMMIRTEVPTPAECEVSVEGNNIVLKPEYGCSVGVYNPDTEMSNIINGSDIVLNYNEYKNAVFTVYGINKIPYIISVSELSKVNRIKNYDNNRTVREDRIWQYAAPNNSDLFNLRFSGKYQFNGKEYYNCYVYSADKEFSPENAWLYSFVREEEGRIYTYWPKFLVYHESLSNVPWYLEVCNVSYDEVLTYDFNLEEGDVYHPLDNSKFMAFRFYDNIPFPDKKFSWKVASKDYVMVGKEEMQRYEMVDESDESTPLFTFVEGIGRVSGNQGFMAMPLVQFIDDWRDAPGPCGQKRDYPDWTPIPIVFNNLFDLEGNLLYKGQNLFDGDKVGVGTVTDPTPKQTDVYGIDGILRLRDASQEDIGCLPSGIYIIKGRKVMIRH